MFACVHAWMECTCVWQNAFSTRVKRKWILGERSASVLIGAALSADQDSFFIMDTKYIHFYLCTHSRLSADNINVGGGMGGGGGGVLVATDVLRMMVLGG